MRTTDVQPSCLRLPSIESRSDSLQDALVPRPRVNLSRSHRVLAPNSSLRAQLTPAERGRRAGRDALKSAAERQVARPKAQRVKRVFRIDIETGEHCGEAVKVIASIEDPVVIKRILEPLYLRFRAHRGLGALGMSAVVLDQFDTRLEYENIDVSGVDDASAYWVSAAWRF